MIKSSEKVIHRDFVDVSGSCWFRERVVSSAYFPLFVSQLHLFPSLGFGGGFLTSLGVLTSGRPVTVVKRKSQTSLPYVTNRQGHG